MFTKLNTILTAIAALSSTAIGAWVAFINAHISHIEERQKADRTSYNFAHEFLTLRKGDWGKNPRQTPAHCRRPKHYCTGEQQQRGESEVA